MKRELEKYIVFAKDEPVLSEFCGVCNPVEQLTLGEINKIAGIVRTCSAR